MTPPVRELVERLAEDAWQTIEDYPDTGAAQIAETTLDGRRLIVRRVRTLGGDQGELFATWQHFPFLTNRSEPIETVEAEHRQHAVVELVIRDLKDQALAHFPSGHFHANAAWTVIAALAHNLLRWTEVIGAPGRAVRAARTARRRLLALPGRLTRHAGRWMLHLPARWPWRHDFSHALARIRALQPPPDSAGPAPTIQQAVSPTGRDHRCPRTPARRLRGDPWTPSTTPTRLPTARGRPSAPPRPRTRPPTPPRGGSRLRRPRANGQ